MVVDYLSKNTIPIYQTSTCVHCICMLHVINVIITLTYRFK